MLQLVVEQDRFALWMPCPAADPLVQAGIYRILCQIHSVGDTIRRRCLMMFKYFIAGARFMGASTELYIESL